NYTKEILNIEREQEKPRKDFACWSDVKNSIWYMFKELYHPENYEWMKITDIGEIKKICETYFNNYYNQDDDKETWFNKVKELSESLGYASNMKEYKANPDAYKGNVADISTVLRVSLTSKSQTPDLYEIIRILGKDECLERINNL
ncbi:MAG: glutamate--tRNA ligase, partial [Bacilli bacterium]|nr:glutamate--tRNA ligase [Bacilli bacterium]